MKPKINKREKANQLMTELTIAPSRVEDYELSLAKMHEILALPEDDATILLLEAGKVGRYAVGDAVMNLIIRHLSPENCALVFETFEVKY